MKVLDDRPSVVDLYYSLRNLPNVKVGLGEALLYEPGYLRLLPLLSFVTYNAERQFTASDRRLRAAWERGKIELFFVLKPGPFLVKVVYCKHQKLEVAWEPDTVKRTPLKTWRVLLVNASVSPYYENGNLLEI